MSPSRPFILRPVATTLLMIGILLVGFVAYRQLPVSALPQVDYPTIQVLTFYPGASPDVMASSVTPPLERQFGQVPGLNQMTSTSSFGSSLITLQFDLDLNIDVAEQEVQAAINAAETYLPQILPNPPIYSKINPADTPILTLALDFRFLAAVQTRRLRRHDPVAENFPVARRRPRQHQRRPKTRGAHSSESHGAGVVRPEFGGRAHRIGRRQCRSGQGQISTVLASGFTIGANDQLLARATLQPAHHRLSKRRPGAACQMSPPSSMAPKMSGKPPG